MRRRQVTAFIDWNSQISNAGQKTEKRIERQVSMTLSYVTDRLSELLEIKEKDTDLFSVDMRIYYGWYQGLTPTPSRRALETLINDRQVPLVVGKARFDWQQPFGDILLDAFNHRLHPRIRVHLPNTFRAPIQQGGEHREKMVDAALICDLLCRARAEPESIRIIMAEDDDIVPAAFVGERWTKSQGGRTVIARVRADPNFLALDGLIWLL
jgi:hypothetical protein